MNMKKFLAKWHELIGIPIAITLYWISPHIIRQIDPTAGEYDGSFIQLGILSVVIFFMFTVIARLFIALVFPRMETHLDLYLFQSLTQWQKSILSVAMFSVLLLALVLIANALN
jgi:hypothetical protein